MLSGRFRDVRASALFAPHTSNIYELINTDANDLLTSDSTEDMDLASQLQMKPDTLVSRLPNPMRKGSQKVYKCTICDKEFDKQYGLKSHLNSHTSERPWTCPRCDASFQRKHDLTRHLKSHSAAKLFQCRWCTKTFSRPDALKRHENMKPGARKRHCRDLRDSILSTDDVKEFTQFLNELEVIDTGNAAGAFFGAERPQAIAFQPQMQQQLNIPHTTNWTLLNPLAASTMLSPPITPGESPAKSLEGKRRKMNLSAEERKANHIASEKRRRQLIKDSFETLIDIVPTCQKAAGHAHSKSMQIMKVAEYIKATRDRNHMYHQVLEVLAAKAAATLAKNQRSDKRRVGLEFAFKTRYQNPLPDLPFEPKLLEYPFPEDQAYRWSNNSLFESVPLELSGESHELCLDLEKMLAADDEPSAETVTKIDPEDDVLFVEPQSNNSTKNFSRNRPIVPWLRRTEYISSEFGKTACAKGDGIETNIMKDRALSEMDLSLQGQIKAIEHTFDYVNNLNLQSLQHPVNKNLKVAEVFPVYPDWELWGNEYAHVVFDSNPLNEEKDTVLLEEALMQPMADPRNPRHKFVAYYRPDEITLEALKQKRKIRDELGDEVEVAEGTEYVYDYVRDFDFETKADGKKIFFLLRPRLGAFYNPFTARLQMRRKRARSKFDGRDMDEMEKPKKVIVSKRKFTSEEKDRRRIRTAEVSPFEGIEEESDDEDEQLDLKMDLDFDQ